MFLSADELSRMMHDEDAELVDSCTELKRFVKAMEAAGFTKEEVFELIGIMASHIGKGE